VRSLFKFKKFCCEDYILTRVRVVVRRFPPIDLNTPDKKLDGLPKLHIGDLTNVARAHRPPNNRIEDCMVMYACDPIKLDLLNFRKSYSLRLIKRLMFLSLEVDDPSRLLKALLFVQFVSSVSSVDICVLTDCWLGNFILLVLFCNFCG
jgi:hypothetical protein